MSDRARLGMSDRARLGMSDRARLGMSDRARLGMSARARLGMVAVLALVWSAWRVDLLGDGIVNGGGWSAFGNFWAAIVDPDLTAEFLRLTWDASLTTIAFAALGTAVALAIGILGAPILSTRLWPSRAGRAMGALAAGAFAVPRGVHEIVWAIVLMQVFGFDPWVAIVAIGVPFGAVTAKVFAETIDEADPAAYDALRALGASRRTALLTATAPEIRGELVSYGFYRLECAVRSAAVVGIIGVGGIGFQLDLSFETLRYGEIWTLLAALVVISGLADAWSTAVRRSTGANAVRVRRWSLAVGAIVLVASWQRVGLRPSAWWDERTRRLGGEALTDLLPPTLGPGGFDELWTATIDTLAMSILALAIAAVLGVALGAAAAAPPAATGRRRRGDRVRRRIGRLVLRAAMLLVRAVPAPIWAFVAVLVLFPGAVPGAVALGVYNAGVIGRLVSEVLEERPGEPFHLALDSGAGRIATFVTVRLPDAAGRIVALLMYRWEVIVRETVVVGVVGAGGLGQLLNEHRAARDFDAVTGTILAMIGLAVVVDAASRLIRRSIGRPAAPSANPTRSLTAAIERRRRVGRIVSAS
ncbi:MAG: ABC transporter permease subunit [Actinomycetota bacterium]